MAVDSASASLLKSLAVLALAIAIALLPGQASPILMTEHNTPFRSTTADHMRFGLKMPPLFCVTPPASWLCTLLTTLRAKLHCPSLSSAIAKCEIAIPIATTNSFCFMVFSLCKKAECRRLLAIVVVSIRRVTVRMGSVCSLQLELLLNARYIMAQAMLLLASPTSSRVRTRGLPTTKRSSWTPSFGCWLKKCCPAAPGSGTSWCAVAIHPRKATCLKDGSADRRLAPEGQPSGCILVRRTQ